MIEVATPPSNSGIPRWRQRWGFSLVLLVAYIATFHLWPDRSRAWIQATGTVSTLLLAAAFVRSARQGYFLNSWDALGHASVILDVLLEGWLIARHDHLGFYLCAAAFAVVIGGYREWLWSRVDRRLSGLGKSAIGTGATGSADLASPAMNADSWKVEFQAVYARGLEAWQAGRRLPSTMFAPADAAFLGSIGCSVQELFDFVDDFARYGEPDYDDVLEVTAIRRDFFVNELKGKPASRRVPMSELPPKAEAVDGIPWLPRIIMKARLKLRGEMPDDLMYGCGGDRQFLAGIRMSLPAFLILVRDSGTDDRRIIDAVKRSAGR
jgi:hypothetical protein